MSFVRIKTIRGKQYLYRQISVRKGKKVRSIMEYLGALGAIAFAATAPGKPGGFSGNRPTDKRSIKHQEESDRDLFAKSRGRFNAKQRQDYEREQKARDAAKDSNEHQTTNLGVRSSNLFGRAIIQLKQLHLLSLSQTLLPRRLAVEAIWKRERKKFPAAPSVEVSIIWSQPSRLAPRR